MSFGSSCLSNAKAGEDVETCKWNKILGAAAPNGWHDLDKVAATAVGLDADYLYPSALVKQYSPDWNVGVDDIGAGFNSDAPWWFPSLDNPTGEGSGTGGATGPTLPRTRTREFGKGIFPSTNPDTRIDDTTTDPTDKIYDFEQTAVHEIMHGLGFVSGWGPNLNGGFLPGGPIVSDNGTSVILGKSHIFDKNLAHASTGIWMRDYATAMRQEATQLSHTLTPGSDFLNEWTTAFTSSKSFQLSQTLFSAVATTPMQLILWFHDSKADPRYVILYTPRAFTGGSSLSHVDASVYGGSSEYLMRPFCTSGTGVDAYTPAHSKLGILGEAVVGVMAEMGYATVRENA
ncbi:hypothetical protein HDU98_003984 [Podochytrium sp. JEL0797]|nr:hypothetical protein HDU98_003984 [Podochytrium sp. JEL0797]